MVVEIDFPFSLNSSGQIKSTSSIDRQVRNHVMSLMNTLPGERLVYRGYGVPLAQQLFEPDDDGVMGEIIAELARAALAEYEPGVSVVSVNSSATESVEAGLVVSEIQYARTDVPDPSTGSYNSVVISESGTPTEVLRG